MRFPYIGRDVDPLPEIPGSDKEWEPLITVRVGGPKSIQLIQGLVDTGASLTLLPMGYFERLGAVLVGTTDIFGSGKNFEVRLARVDLGLRSPRPTHIWSALVGFDARRTRALWGKLGFLEHFTATFNTHRRYLTLKPNGTFADPIYE